MELNATFDVYHREEISADTCPDKNIIDWHTLEELGKAGVEHKVEDFIHPKTFNMSANLSDGKLATFKFTKAVVMETEIHIR